MKGLIGNMEKSLLKNHDFAIEKKNKDQNIANDWNIKPDQNTFHYSLVSKNTGGYFQKIEGEGRGNGYVWQKFSVVPGQNYKLRSRVKTSGEITAQIWFFFLDEEGNTIIRKESNYILGNSDWELIKLECQAPSGSKTGMIFTICFTVQEKAFTLWDFVDLQLSNSKENEGKKEINIHNLNETTSGTNIIIPKPKVFTEDRERNPFILNSLTEIVIVRNHEKSTFVAAKILKEFLKKEYNIAIKIKSVEKLENNKNKIFIGVNSNNPYINRWKNRNNYELPSDKEAYLMEVNSDAIFINGGKQRGVIYAVQSLIQLINKNDDCINISSCFIKDWPDLSWRGLHIPMDFNSTEFLKELIENVLVRYKYNKLIIECSMIKWDSHPEIWQAEASTKNNLQEIIKMAKENLIEVIPLVQSLGHCRWLFYNNKNMDICEDPENPWCYNPLDKRSYEVIFDIYREALELFDPDFFHIGHDEVRMVGEFPVSNAGKKLGFENLFVNDTNKISEFLLKRNVRPMMWADVVQDCSFKSLDKLNKNIIMVDWQYHPFNNYQGIDYLENFGFTTIGSTWYKPDNIKKFADYMYKKKKTGLLQTTWAGFFGSAKALNKELKQYKAHILAAEEFWHTGAYKSFSQLPYNPELITKENLNDYSDIVPDWGKSW